MKFSDYFSIGYGPAEFRQDRHVAWVIFLGYAIVRVPQINSISWAGVAADALMIGKLMAVAVLKSWLLRTGNGNDGPKPPELGA